MSCGHMVNSPNHTVCLIDTVYNMFDEYCITRQTMSNVHCGGAELQIRFLVSSGKVFLRQQPQVTVPSDRERYCTPICF
jgi:hypothetical protein